MPPGVAATAAAAADDDVDAAPLIDVVVVVVVVEADVVDGDGDGAAIGGAAVTLTDGFTTTFDMLPATVIKSLTIDEKF